MSSEGAGKGGRKSKEPTGDPNYADDADQPENSRYSSVEHQRAQDYLTDHKIYELFNFLIGHLLVDEPDDPIEYLGNLLDKCMLFKSGIEDDAPLLFTARHIGSLFESMDPSGGGSITLEQYRIGMKTLGISRYDQRPAECTPGRIDRHTFQQEAEKCLVESLAEMVGKCD